MESAAAAWPSRMRIGESDGSRLKLLTFTAPAEAAGKLRFQRLEIGDVLRSTDGALICHEELFAEEAHRQVVEVGANLLGECFFDVNAADAGEEVNAIRRSSELNDLIGLSEVCRADAWIRNQILPAPR